MRWLLVVPVLLAELLRELLLLLLLPPPLPARGQLLLQAGAHAGTVLRDLVLQAALKVSDNLLRLASKVSTNSNQIGNCNLNKNPCWALKRKMMQLSSPHLILLELLVNLLDLFPKDLLLGRRRRQLLRRGQGGQGGQLGRGKGQLVRVLRWRQGLDVVGGFCVILTQRVSRTHNALGLGEIVEVEIDGDVCVDLIDWDVHVLAQHLLDLDADKPHALFSQVH